MDDKYTLHSESDQSDNHRRSIGSGALPVIPGRNPLRALRVLSLDGGGVRGLSSLLILRRIMYHIKPTDNLYDIAKPCDYFNLICGTSTGGLIAIMLGRLKMGVQESIDAYLDLAKDVFQEKGIKTKYFKWVGPILGMPRFRGDTLADAVKHIVAKKTGSTETLMFDKNENACKVFVCATRTANIETALLRTYRSDEEDSTRATIWEAARATSAAPTFFPSIKFGHPEAEYVDGAMVHNNPIRLLMREVVKLWGPDAELACVISVGTGAPPSRKLGAMGHQILMACAKLATNAEAIARNFKADQQGQTLHKERKYFRFNVAQGLQNVKLEEWQAFDLMSAATKSYLEDVNTDVEACSDRLCFRRRPSAGAATKSLPLTSRTEYINITRTSSPHFTGRTDMLESIQSYFDSTGRSSPRTAVLIGLGGIGKTQIALQFYEWQAAEYPIALFVECNSEQESMTAFVHFAQLVIDQELRQCPGNSYEETAKMLGFSALLSQPSGDALSDTQARIVNAVKSWLGRQQQRFLVIFDNADDPAGDKLSEFIPQYGHGDIIITTRDSDAKALGEPFMVEEMSKEEAISLLASTSGLTLDTDHLIDTAAQIADVLGYLPLAIDQASGYLSNSDLGLTEFLPAYNAHAKIVLSKVPNAGMLGYKSSAFTTWEMSFERLQALSPTSAAFMHRLGFLHNQDICERLYKSETTAPCTRWGLEGHAFSFNEAFSFLVKLCLIRRNGQGAKRSYDIHPVVHVWIRERLDILQQAFYAKETVVCVAAAFPPLGDSVQSWELHRRLYPHAKTCWTNAKAHAPQSVDHEDPEFLDALEVIGTAFSHRGNYAFAEEALLRAHQGSELAYGRQARKTLKIAATLASIYDLRGNLSSSEKLYRVVLEGLVNTLGPDHQDVFTVLHNLANVLKYMGKVDEAEKFYKRALQGRKKIAEDDLSTLETMDALASLLYDSKRATEAEPLRLFVLKTRTRLLGAEHPDTLTTTLNMGILYSGLSKDDLALQYFDKAYEGRKALLKLPSPSALNTLSLIVAFYANIGHAKKAELMYREILAGQQAVLGDMHPDTLWTENCLNVVLFVKEKSAESVQTMERSFTDIETVLGKNNLDTLWMAHNLALVYGNLGRYEESEELQKRVVKGYKDQLGSDHVNSLYMINDLGEIYMRAKKFKKAEAQFKEAYEGKCKNFGFKSPHTLYTATFLACVMRETGNSAEAEELFQKTLDTTVEILGEDHADTCLCRMYLADLYIEQRRYKQAQELYQKVYETRRKLKGEGHTDTRYMETLLVDVERRVRDPSNAQQAPTPAMQATTVPAQFGFRARNDTVKVLF